MSLQKEGSFLAVQSGEHLFLLEHERVLEVISLQEPLEKIGDALVYRVRGDIVPLVDLGKVFNLGEGISPKFVVVVATPAGHFGLLVERTFQMIESKTQSLDRFMSRLGVYSSIAIVDNVPALVIDIDNLLGTSDVKAAARVEETKHYTDEAPLETFLALDAGVDHKLAVVFQDVLRIETLAPERIEKLGSKRVYRHGTEIIPLGQVEPFNEEEDSLVVILTHDSGKAALMIREVVDVVQAPRSNSEDGFSPSVTISGRLFEIFDTAMFIEQERMSTTVSA